VSNEPQEQEQDERERLIRVGQGSADILGNEAFVSAVAAVKEAIVVRWRNADTVSVREQAHAMDAALNGVIHALKVQMDNGQYEAGLLEQENHKDA
jgi:hypothetical protein